MFGAALFGDTYYGGIALVVDVPVPPPPTPEPVLTGGGLSARDRQVFRLDKRGRPMRRKMVRRRNGKLEAVWVLDESPDHATMAFLAYHAMEWMQ